MHGELATLSKRLHMYDCKCKSLCASCRKRLARTEADEDLNRLMFGGACEHVYTVQAEDYHGTRLLTL